MSFCRTTKVKTALLLLLLFCVCPSIQLCTAFTFENVWHRSLFNSNKRYKASFLSSRGPDHHTFFAEDLANNIVDEIDIPFFPKPILAFALSNTIKRLSSDLSEPTIQRLEEFFRDMDGSSDYSSWEETEIDALADTIAAEINPTIDLPVFDEVQEEAALQQIWRVLLQRIQASTGEERRQLLSITLLQSRDLISDDGRVILAKKIQDKLPEIPFLPDEMEAKLIDTVVDSCIDTIERSLPEAVVASIRSESPTTIIDMKAQMIQQISSSVQVPGLSKEQALSLVDQMVDVLLDLYLDLSPSEADRMFLTEEEQMERLVERQDRLQWEIELSQRRHKREQNNLQEQLDAVNSGIDNLQNNSSK